jgi:XTP/dITP diphosphohydrolase
MSKDLVIATRNKGKRDEFEKLAGGLGLRLRSLDEFPGVVDPPETGSTFRENAIIKARAAALATGAWALGDDSGLCVDALNGAPGIYSARYAEGTDETRWQKLLRELKATPEAQRGASFVCVLALAGPAGDILTTEGRCAGRIGTQPRGSAGFGYDPVFLVEGDPLGRTMAELSDAEKNRISHRGRAFDAMRPHLAGLPQPG